MMNKTTLIALLALVGSLMACNLFGTPPDPTTPAPTNTPPSAEATTAPEEDGNETEPTAESSEETEPDPAPTSVVVAPIPDGWEQTTVEALGLTIAHPPGWEVFVVEDRAKVDVRETDGDGWVEFGIINAETASFWSIADPSADPQAMLEGILAPASQDGTFQEAGNVGGDIWVARGRDTIYEEIVLYGVAPFEPDRLLMVGHVTADIPEEEQPTAAEEYFPIYTQMLIGITPSD